MSMYNSDCAIDIAACPILHLVGLPAEGPGTAGGGAWADGLVGGEGNSNINSEYITTNSIY